MNFLLRSGTTPHQVVAELPPAVPDPSFETSRTAATEDSFPPIPSAEDCDRVARSSGCEKRGEGPSTKRDRSSFMRSFSDVSEEEGWITIPSKKIPDNWTERPDIHSLQSLDRSFVFPGEQVHILAFLSASKQEMEIITPFKVAAAMSNNDNRKISEKQNGHVLDGAVGEASPESRSVEQNDESLVKDNLDTLNTAIDGESILGMEDHKRQTEALLHSFENSHFFARLAESVEPLWSKNTAPQMVQESFRRDKAHKKMKNRSGLSAFIDRGEFDPHAAGGVARNALKCCALANGDIAIEQLVITKYVTDKHFLDSVDVFSKQIRPLLGCRKANQTNGDKIVVKMQVLLQVNVVDSLIDPVIEILQFEKHQDRSDPPEMENGFDNMDKDPSEDLLKWLLPLDNTISPPSRSLSPTISSSQGIGSASNKSGTSASSGSQLFSFGHFRSQSMSSLPQNTASISGPLKTQSSKPSFDIEEWDGYSSYELQKGQRSGPEELLSFRGVSLEPERFSVCGGLEGIYIPGRRWRRNLEIIQPIEIHSFAADCNTDDFLCVQIKNVVPAHTPDIVIYVDAITIIIKEAGKSGSPSALPIACIEAGDDHSLPNLALRKGEEHSFILKPTSSARKHHKAFGERKLKSPSLHIPSFDFEKGGNASRSVQYAVMVSCRCNYTESRLFFKQPTQWKPRDSRELMVSVASEISEQSCGPYGRADQLPVQVLTLQASNLTSEDLTLTVLAPASTTPPSVVSLNSAPSSPVSPFLGFSEFTERVNSEKGGTTLRKAKSTPPIPLEIHDNKGDAEHQSASLNKPLSNFSDVIPNSGLGCTHLWLQSRVPLGCLPSQSSATIKLELLPLTDGIIPLDTLQFHVNEKDRTYIPEQSLKINATSSISSGIL